MIYTQMEYEGVSHTTRALPRVAFITANYGGYEKTCKPFAKQTIDSDFICFMSPGGNVHSNGWIVDTTPYHSVNRSSLDTPNKMNSIDNNKHTFNIAKYYKQNFQNIPRLQNYEFVIWIDGSIEITNPRVSEFVIDTLTNKTDTNVITIDHTERNGLLANELKESHFERYTSTFWFGQSRPYQDVDEQYRVYLRNGFKDIGVWVTCFVAWNMKHPKTVPMLNQWYDDLLTLSTQDQIGFPYAAWSVGIQPIGLGGHFRYHDSNDYFRKYSHGQ